MSCIYMVLYAFMQYLTEAMDKRNVYTCANYFRIFKISLYYKIKQAPCSHTDTISLHLTHVHTHTWFLATVDVVQMEEPLTLPNQVTRTI